MKIDATILHIPYIYIASMQGGPPTSYKYGYKSTYRGYNPSYPIIRPFIGVITPFITSRGPPCGTGIFPYMETIKIRMETFLAAKSLSQKLTSTSPGLGQNIRPIKDQSVPQEKTFIPMTDP